MSTQLNVINFKTFISLKMLEEKNVKFYMNERVTEIRGENGKVITFSLVAQKIFR